MKDRKWYTRAVDKLREFYPIIVVAIICILATIVSSSLRADVQDDESSVNVEDRYVVTVKEHIPAGDVTRWSRQPPGGNLTSVLSDRPEAWYLRVWLVDTSETYVVKIDDPSIDAILVGDEIMLRRGDVRP